MDGGAGRGTPPQVWRATATATATIAAMQATMQVWRATATATAID